MPEDKYAHVIETRIRYLTTSEGGRKSGVASGYRGDFVYDGMYCHGQQSFPDYGANDFVDLGIEVRALVYFPREQWDRVHQHKLHVGKSFEIREGPRVVGTGVITRLDVEQSD